MGRTNVLITNQFGVESTPGTPVSANRKLLDMMFSFSPEMKNQFFRAHGNKFMTAGVRHRHFSMGKFEGVYSYNSLPYVLSSLFSVGSITQIGSTGGYTWPFTVSSGSADSGKTFTFQKGDATAAQQSAHGAMTSLNIEFGEETLNNSGDVIAGPIDNAATLSSTPTEIEEKPVSVSDLDWYIDTTGAGIGVTKWTDVLRASLSIPVKVQPKMVHNTANPGFKELVEVAVEEAKLSVIAEFNAQTRAIYDAMNVDSLAKRFIRHQAIGDNIGVSADHKIWGDFCVKLEKASELPDVQKVYAYQFDFRITHDKTWGKAMSWEVVNKLSAL